MARNPTAAGFALAVFDLDQRRTRAAAQDLGAHGGLGGLRGVRHQRHGDPGGGRRHGPPARDPRLPPAAADHRRHAYFGALKGSAPVWWASSAAALRTHGSSPWGRAPTTIRRIDCLPEVSILLPAHGTPCAGPVTVAGRSPSDAWAKENIARAKLAPAVDLDRGACSPICAGCVTSSAASGVVGSLVAGAPGARLAVVPAARTMWCGAGRARPAVSDHCRWRTRARPALPRFANREPATAAVQARAQRAVIERGQPHDWQAVAVERDDLGGVDEANAPCSFPCPAVVRVEPHR
jgi:hypothetical protein